MVTASSVLTLFELISAVMENVPTAPEKEAGLPEGKGFDVDSTGEVVNTLAHIPIRVEEAIEDTTATRLLHTDLHHASNLPLLIVIFPERCGYRIT